MIEMGMRLQIGMIQIFHGKESENSPAEYMSTNRRELFWDPTQ